MSGEAFGYGLCGCFIIGVCAIFAPQATSVNGTGSHDHERDHMKRISCQASNESVLLTQDHISLLGFLLEQFSTVKVAIHQSHFSILAGNLGTFIAVANKARNVKLGMGVGNGIKGIATNVSCRPGAGT